MTPKQQRFVEELGALKISALRMICRHLGMLPATPELAQRHRALVGDGLLAWALLALGSDLPRWKRSAAMLLLDLVSSDWRAVAGPSIMGPNVERDDPLVREWRHRVIANDNGRCRRCGSTSELHAHHIIRWAQDPSQRLVVENGMTLCRPCHTEEHRRYG